jgi:catalase
MAVDFKAEPEATRPPLGRVGTLTKFTLIGVVLAAVAGSFVYLGGWCSPNELTPARFTDGFEEVAGVHPGFRRNHAKGLGVSGSFESNGNGIRLSTAVVFRPGRLPVIGRFSLGGGQPYVADKPDTVRGLGLQFSLPDGEAWRTAMVNLPVFPVSTPEAFYEQLLASKPDPETGKPDPEKMQAFLARHPETVRAMTLLKDRPVSSGFENCTFYGLNAFRFTDAAGNSTPVRWLVRPQQSFEPAGPPAASEDRNYLFDALLARIGRGPLRWHLLVIVGQPGDPTNDATLAWPEGRETVDVGTLTLDRAESDETSAATDINFDPLVLPAGIAPSDDPLLSARSAVYSQSYTRRAGEAKQPPAITPADVRKGER